MNLAQLIHKALVNPQFRLALETNTLSLEETGLSARELMAAAEALRQQDKPGKSNVLFTGITPNSIGWRI